MRIAFITVGVLLLSLSAYAQSTGKITGNIVDASNKQALEGATISVLNHQSGIFINHGVSGKKGNFQINNLPLNISIEVIVSFTGYRDTTSIQVLKDKLKHTGNWMMHMGSNDLDSIVFTVHKAPFIVKKDTVEFDARAFKSLPADMLEDLLQKLPGMVIDQQGNVTVNGKKVNKIKVDGRDFFGGNLKTALENLPGSTVDKVQVYDTRERGTEHNSIIQPITDQVTLNVTLKKQNKNRVIGHAGIAGGTSERYNADVFANTLDGDNGKGIYARTGNAPSGHVIRDDMGAGKMASGNGVIKNNTDIGLSLNKKLFGNGKLSSSLSTKNNNQSTETLTDRTNILPDSTFMYNNSAKTNTISHVHEFTFNYENNIDTLQQLSVTPSVSFSDNTNKSSNSAKSFANTIINTQENTTTTRDHVVNVGNRVNYNRLSRDKKTSISVTWELGLNHSNGNQINNSINKYFKDSARTVALDQNSLTADNSLSNNLSLNFSRNFNKYFTAIFNYSFAQSANNTSRDTYNYDQVSGNHDLLDSLYSVHNKYTNITHLPTASIGYSRNKWMVELGAGFRHINQINTIVWKDSLIKLVQNSINPRLSVARQITKNAMWIVNYGVNAEQPTSDQLAPVQDNTNPLYIKLGNPYLKSSLAHNIQTQLYSFSRDYKTRLMIMGSGTITAHQIVDNTYYDSLGRQVTTFVNTNGNNSFNLNFSAGTTFRFHSWNLNVGLGALMSNSRSTGFTNKAENVSNTTHIAPQLDFSLGYKQYFMLFANGSVDINSTNYSLAGINGINYNTKRALVAIRSSPVKRLLINSSLNYFYNSQLPDGFQKSRAMVNASVNYNFLKSEKLSVGLSVVDLFNTNVNINRTISPTAIETTQSTTLKRYALLSMAYRFSTLRG